MDLNKDFTTQTIALTPDYEGEVKATLISSNSNHGSRKSVLYVHGYIDYFFHAHMGQEFNTQGYDFYSLDLRKYGRSLMEHQHPNYCKDIEEYFEEISIALRQIHEASNEKVVLLAHSTGGLITANYMNFGYFAAMGLFALGCAAGNCYGGSCETKKSSSLSEQEVEFEEIHSK